MLDVSSREKLRSSGQGLSHLVERRAQSVRKISRQTARTDDWREQLWPWQCKGCHISGLNLRRNIWQEYLNLRHFPLLASGMLDWYRAQSQIHAQLWLLTTNDTTTHNTINSHTQDTTALQPILSLSVIQRPLLTSMTVWLPLSHQGQRCSRGSTAAFNGLPPHNVTPLPPWEQSGSSHAGTQFADHLVPEPSRCQTAEAAQETVTPFHWCHESRPNCDVTLRLYSKGMRTAVTAARGTGGFRRHYRALTVRFKKNVMWTEALFTLQVEFFHYVGNHQLSTKAWHCLAVWVSLAAATQCRLQLACTQRCYHSHAVNAEDRHWQPGCFAQRNAQLQTALYAWRQIDMLWRHMTMTFETLSSPKEHKKIQSIPRSKHTPPRL